MRPIIRYHAYFVVVRETATDKIIYSDIWSSPSWEQSMVERGTVSGVYLEDVGDSFHEARENLLGRLAHSYLVFGSYAAFIGKLRGSTANDFKRALDKISESLKEYKKRQSEVVA